MGASPWEAKMRLYRSLTERVRQWQLNITSAVGQVSLAYREKHTTTTQNGIWVLTPDDLRGLTPLIYNHVNPYGLFLLTMNERLLSDGDAAA
jgi:hypothetical protein